MLVLMACDGLTMCQWRLVLLALMGLNWADDVLVVR